MKKLTFIAIVVLVAFGCKKEEAPTIEDFVLDMPLYAVVHDANGFDLLNPNNANALQNIKMYRFENGLEIPLLASRNDYLIYAPSTTDTSYKGKALGKNWSVYVPTCYIIPQQTSSEKVMYDESYKSDYTIRTSKIKIKWNDTDTDIITSEHKCFLPKRRMRLLKVWVNGELKYESKVGVPFHLLEKTMK